MKNKKIVLDFGELESLNEDICLDVNNPKICAKKITHNIFNPIKKNINIIKK